MRDVRLGQRFPGEGVPGTPYPAEGDVGEVDAGSDDALVGEPAGHLAPEPGRYVGCRFSRDRPVRVRGPAQVLDVEVRRNRPP